MNMISVELLTKEVRKYPCLWNKTLKEYRDKNMRNNAWRMISKALKKPVPYLKCEWRKLSYSYRRAMLRRKTKSGQAAKKMELWKYEEQMSFLPSDLTSQEIQSKFDVGDDNKEDKDSSIDEDNQNEEEEEQTEEQNAKDSKSQKSRKYFHKKCLDKESDIDKIVTIIQDKNKEKKQTGELKFFFASACESTKCLPRCLQLKVKQEVMNIIINAEMKMLNNESISSLHSASPNVSCDTSIYHQTSTSSSAYCQSTSLPRK